MLEKLLQRDHRVIVLVREKFQRQAREFVSSLDLPGTPDVKLLIGDVVDLDLGLSGAEIREILDEVQLVYHLAGIYHLGVDSRTTWRVNVEGTRSVLELAAGMRSLERLVVMSTAFVSGVREGIIREDELDVGQRFRNEYERSKLEAERLCRRAMSTLPISVVRPGLVLGDSRTGAIDRIDGAYWLINAIVNMPLDIHLPLPGTGDEPLNMVPIDYVIDAIYAISRDPDAIGGTFHLTDPNPLSARQVFEVVAEKAGRRAPRGRLPSVLTKALVHVPGLERLSRASRQFLDQFDQRVLYNSAHTMRVLSKHGITCPPFESYAEQVVDHVRRVSQERPPRRGAARAAS
jgi:nucleoside-diphosphate-sugar epimerase